MNPIEVSSEDFRRLAERITDLAARYLENLDDQRISPETRGPESLNIFGGAPPEQGMGEEALARLPDVLRLSRAQNGRFFGYVLGSGEPVAAIADLLASVLNQNVTAWRSGPAAVAIEQTVVNWLPRLLWSSHWRWLTR
jgi:glutamate/tyrosine decarboxylase-like PLP-dependent enzyme